MNQESPDFSRGRRSIDLPIKSDRNKLDLYTIARGLAEGLGKNDNELLNGIFTDEPVIDPVAKNKFEIVQRIVEIKREENAKLKTAIDNKAHKEKLLELLAKKKDQSLDNLSIEEIEAKLKTFD